jgi:hypothetical protein
MYRFSGRCCYMSTLSFLTTVLPFYTTGNPLNSVALLMQNNTIHSAVLRIFCFDASTACVGLSATEAPAKFFAGASILSFYTTENALILPVPSLSAATYLVSSPGQPLLERTSFHPSRLQSHLTMLLSVKTPP